MKLKRGTIREDGMIFWAYTSKGNEWWMNKEKFDIYFDKRKNTSKEKIKEYSKKYRENKKLN